MLDLSVLGMPHLCVLKCWTGNRMVFEDKKIIFKLKVICSVYWKTIFLFLFFSFYENPTSLLLAFQLSDFNTYKLYLYISPGTHTSNLP